MLWKIPWCGESSSTPLVTGRVRSEVFCVRGKDGWGGVKSVGFLIQGAVASQ